jgi:phytoene synthase
MSWSPASRWISTAAERLAIAPDTYATFADLYRYCYLVASVVGLVCIRIFGYTDPRAEKLAEETGIAFQLTNILRDVAEDAERNRVYLPLKIWRPTTFRSIRCCIARPARRPRPTSARLLAAIAQRAEDFYRSAEALAAADRPREPARAVGAGSIYHGAAQAH